MTLTTARRALMALTLLLPLGAPAHADCFLIVCGLDTEGTMAKTGLVDDLYREVFGRGSTLQERSDWAKKGFRDSDLSGAQTTQLRAALMAQLHGSAAELANVVTRVTQSSMGVRLSPNNPFFKLLTNLGAQPDSTYRSLVAFTRTYLQDAQVSGVRAALIERAYLDSLGRKPSSGDAAYWQAQIVQTGANYADVLRAAEEWVLSAGNEAEFAALIRRAFQLSGRPQPSMEKIAQIRVRSGAALRSFDGWKTYIRTF
ncbi:hypothetical protein [Deinococcus radiotolerans]|uniref:Uncharacterized protein n=1 Tax=Deinococcus radiotolerans TaxID=1309407 RepID=A0ABQ2FHU6_9DEIO|nr:hypothetical protein [Deinococcus radiotolerans]GGK97440.1 hypothetical protein GCM10010844_14640 [Deinococcus radiotolerans]